MKLKYYLIGILITFATSSCNDFLDLEPISEESTANAYQRASQIEAALTGAYESFQSDAYVWNNIMFQDIRSDNHYAGGDNPSIFEIDLLNISPTNDKVYQSWSNIYNAILKANLVIQRINDVNDQTLTTERRNQIIGEAYFLRAYHYYNLINLFGAVPLILEENSIDLFAAEMALDLYYFAMIKEQVKTLAHGKDREILKGFFGSEADIKNIMWIYRGRHYYKLSKEIIYRYLIPYGNRIKMTFIDALIEAPDEERLVELIRSRRYNQVFDENPVRWELAFMRSFLQKQLNNLRIYPFSLAPIIGYIYAKESEISNITTIIEGVRYEVSPDTMKTDLIIKV
jgi:hypothetical protein